MDKRILIVASLVLLLGISLTFYFYILNTQNQGMISGSTTIKASVFKYPPYKLPSSFYNILSRDEVKKIVEKYLEAKGFNNYKIVSIEFVNQSPSSTLWILYSYYKVEVNLSSIAELELRIVPGTGTIFFVWAGTYIEETCSVYAGKYLQDKYLEKMIKSELSLMGFPLNNSFGIKITHKEAEPNGKIFVMYVLTYKGYPFTGENTLTYDPCTSLLSINTPSLIVFYLINENRIRLNKSIDVNDVKEIIGNYLSRAYGKIYQVNISCELVLDPIDVNCDGLYDVIELCYKVSGCVITETRKVDLKYSFPYYVSAVSGELIPYLTTCK